MLLDDVGGFTLHYEPPRDPEGVVVRPLDFCRISVTIKPQQEGVTRPRSQWQATKEVGAIATREITDGGAEEQDV